METGTGIWGQNTALWAIVVVALIILAFWWCHRAGDDKANLAASIQNLYGRVNTLEPVVASNTATLVKVGNTLSAAIQGVADIKADVDALDGAVFAPRCGNHNCGCGNGCGQTRFVKSTPYTAGTTTLEETDTCCNG